MYGYICGVWDTNTHLKIVEADLRNLFWNVDIYHSFVGVSNIFGFAVVPCIILKHSYRTTGSYMHRIASEDKIIVHGNHVNMDYFECHDKVNWIPELDVVAY
jgi:hypothetical protein